MEHFIVGKAHEDEPELKQPEHAGIVPMVHFRWILSGPSRSGKTNLARYTYDKFYTTGAGSKSWFDTVYLLSPTAKIDFQVSKILSLMILIYSNFLYLCCTYSPHSVYCV